MRDAQPDQSVAPRLAATMQPPSAFDLHLYDATAPPPSECGNTDEGQAWRRHERDNADLLSLTHSAPVLGGYGTSIVRVAQEAVSHIDAKQSVHENQQLVAASQYCNKLGVAVKARLRPVLDALEAGRLQLRIVISQDDTLSSIKKQISSHKAIFDQLGYPAWSKDILGTGRDYRKHSWCQLLFRGAFASVAQSMRSDFMHLFTAYTDIQRALDVRAIEDLRDYIQVLKSLEQIYERVKQYGMCSTEYQVTIKSGFNGRDRQTITAGPEGCRMSEAAANSFRSKQRPVAELLVSPPPASGQDLPRYPQIVKLKVAKEVVASKFGDLLLRDVEDLGLHKLESRDLKLLLNTQRFANGAELLEQKFYLGNHVTDGFMSNLARQWLLGDAEGNEDAFRHLLLLPDRTSIDLVRVMMAAVDLGTANQVRSVCWEISAKKEVEDCCDAIASVSVSSGIVARARLCIACLEPAVLGAVRSATRIYRQVKAGRDRADDGQSFEELKILLRFAETDRRTAGTDTWQLMLTAYLHLKEIGSTYHSAALHAEQIGSKEDAQKLEELIRCLRPSSMRRQIVDASRGLQDLEVYVTMLNGEQLAGTNRDVSLLMRLLSTAGYRRVAQLHVPIEPGSEQQNVAAWMSSGPSEAVCMFGEIFLRGNPKDGNPAPRRDHALLQALTGKARLDGDGRWEFFHGFKAEQTVSTMFWIFQETKTKTTPVWKNILDIDCVERSHAHLSEQIYFHMNGSDLPNARGLSLVNLERDGAGDLVGRGLTITSRIAKDIWHLGGNVYYSMSRGRLWKIETEGSSYYAEQVEKVVGRFIDMSRGGLENMTIS